MYLLQTFGNILTLRNPSHQGSSELHNTMHNASNMEKVLVPRPLLLQNDLGKMCFTVMDKILNYLKTEGFHILIEEKPSEL